MNKKKILEGDIKALILNYLREVGLLDRNSIVMNELTVNNYARRVDLAIWTSGKLIAFEVKSEADSLVRLEGQVETYLKYFDKVIVVSDPKFVSKLNEKLPNHVGIWEANATGLKIKRKGRYNSQIEKSRMIDLMDVVDLKKLTNSLKMTSSRNRDGLKKALVDAPKTKLRDGVYKALLRKFNDSSSLFFDKTKKREISRSDLKLLSRFHCQREREKIEKKKDNLFWKNFDKHASKLEILASSN
ncbi:MAG: sce7726 family protein [Halobacteriovoraceae bacterium]|nr:sce7726 family protein [Halobacteriovoraceae bacterium]